MSELSHEPVLQQFPDAEWDEAAGAVIAPLGQARTVAEWLLGQGVDYCSNVTGVDYLEREVKEKAINDAGEQEMVTRTEPGRIPHWGYFSGINLRDQPNSTCSDRVDIGAKCACQQDFIDIVPF